jgi:hypothetical protein
MKTFRLGFLAIFLAVVATGCDAATEITATDCIVPAQGSGC